VAEMNMAIYRGVGFDGVSRLVLESAGKMPALQCRYTKFISLQGVL